MSLNPIELIIQNNKEFIEVYSRYSKSRLINSPHHVALISDTPSLIFNQVMDAQLNPETIQVEIDAIMAPYKEKNNGLIWKVWPSAKPDDLTNHLVQYGFQRWGDNPGMLADLTQLPEAKPLPEGIRIFQITNYEHLNDWAIPIMEGFNLRKPDGKFFFDMYKEFGFAEDWPLKVYIGYLKNRPVSCGTLYLGKDGVAGIWNVATLEKARGKGIGTAITHLMCQDALDRGYRSATLVASSAGLRIYQSLGFKEYCKVVYHGWIHSKKIS